MFFVLLFVDVVSRSRHHSVNKYSESNCSLSYIKPFIFITFAIASSNYHTKVTSKLLLISTIIPLPPSPSSSPPLSPSLPFRLPSPYFPSRPFPPFPSLPLPQVAECQVGQECTATFSFSNPLDVPLTDCFFSMEVGGACRPRTMRVNREVRPRETFTYTQTFVPRRSGDRRLVAAFTSRQLHDITGSRKLTIRD